MKWGFRDNECVRLIAAAVAALAGLATPPGLAAAGFDDPNADRDGLPDVPAGFEVSFFAREPLVRQPCSIAFDAKGRLCVGMGPQYRSPKPDTPGDSIVLVLDDNGDGKADRTKTFATGFNAIQGLAWHGRDLWVANAPDLTLVRDLDGDDEADEYIRIYTDLGNLEHGLHGLNWAPDGKLYMSKGNSKGLTQPGRTAPKAFRELWGVKAPAGTPDFPEPRTFKKGAYQKAFHDPEDDWGREGGVLRCDDGGANLEIISRGMRNPWDITFDTGFNWLGTDNDQTTGDRVIMPFFDAHFGWNHPWSAHWGTDPHPPSAPVSGPLFEGSGTGMLFGDSSQFPPPYRGVFFINDWLRKTTFVWRPRWDGALLRPAREWEPFVKGGKALFRPTDMEFGPDGALWILGWSSGYGAEYKDGQMTSEGRVFRVMSKSATPPLIPDAKRSRPQAQWTVPELIGDFDGPLPVWRINAQDELVRRGEGVKAGLIEALRTRGISEARETWIAWTLGRSTVQDRSMDEWFSARALDETATLNLRVQSLRILAHRGRRGNGGHAIPGSVITLFHHTEPRLRFEVVQALGQSRQGFAIPALLELLAVESDPTTFYAAWQTLSRIQDSAVLKALLADSRGGVRRAALLALLEGHTLTEADVRPLAADADAGVRDVAMLWLRKTSAGGETALVRGRPLNGFKDGVPAGEPPIGLAKSIRSRSGARYSLVHAGLRPGARPYIDRGYELKQVPDSLTGLDFIQTANNDDGSRGDAWMSFETLMPSRVYVALDARSKSVPGWLRERYRRAPGQIRADHWTFHLYTREFPAGRIELGGNTDDGQAGGKGNYIVALEALPLPPPSGPTAVDSSLDLLPNGNPQRGEWLFHARDGAGCYNCHRLNGHGNHFGPDLATLRERASVRHIVQSMLEPNVVITEGFNLQTVETSDAEYSGILLEESGLSLTLGLVNGQRQVIAKSGITSRKTAAASAMPAYDSLLPPQQVADLTTYLMARRETSTPVTNSSNADAQRPGGDPSRPGPQGDSFQFSLRLDRIIITHSRQPVGEFVFQDDKILRPYFANVHAPGGVKATRNHPPLAGVDATDHETMHPGIWLAFGDVGGTDFWRNQGRIEHSRFTESPTVRDGRLAFATEGRLRTADGRNVCSLTNRFTLIRQPDAWIIIWDAAFHSNENDISFGDQEEMGFGARLATSITEKNGGIIISSAGRTTARNTWGQSAEWCDYSGEVDGRRVGITLIADPANFRPSWWHNRDYGVFVANPFGRAAMNQGEKSIVTVKRGEVFRLRFGAVIHQGTEYRPANAMRAYLELPRDLHGL